MKPADPVKFRRQMSYNGNMRVLMISGDPKVLDPESDAGTRAEWYREALGELDILLCRGNIFSFTLGFFLGLAKMRKVPDVVTAQDMEQSVLAWFYFKIFGTPWQMQIHSDIFSPQYFRQSLKNKIRVRLAEFLLPRASGIRVVSRKIKRSILQKYPALVERITVLPIFVDAEYIRAYTIKTDLRKKYPGRFIILMASRITKEKNILLAVEALRELTTHPKDPLLLVVGDGPELSRLKKASEGIVLERNIQFLPFTDDIFSYYKTADLFLLTSNYEGYGMTLVEASIAGIKIISTDVGIASDILPFENIVEPGDKVALAVKIHDALEGHTAPAREPIYQTKSEYLALYKESLEQCLKNR